MKPNLYKAFGELMGVIALIGGIVYYTAPRISESKTIEGDFRPPEEEQTITLAKTLVYHGRNDVLFVDVRAQEFFLAGHIANAISAPDPIAQDGIDLSSRRLAAVVVYCDSSACGLAELAAMRMRKRSKHVYVYNGGWNEWSALKLPTHKQ